MLFLKKIGYHLHNKPAAVVTLFNMVLYLLLLTLFLEQF